MEGSSAGEPISVLPFEGTPADSAPRVENRGCGAWTRCMPFPNPPTMFKPGQSGNPGGRPRGTSLTKLIAEVLEQDQLKDVDMKDAKKVAEALANTIVKKAVEGDYRFAELVINRIDGKVPNPITIDTHDTTEFLRNFLFGATDAADPTG